MIRIRELRLVCSKEELKEIGEGKVLINTINAFSYNNARKDERFAEALMRGDYLIPDGASIVKACRWVKSECQPRERIAGYDLFEIEMERLNQKGGVCMFVGSSERVLRLIRERASREYRNVRVVTYSPPYKEEFTREESGEMVRAINEANPDLLWIGMTAPKQEKWTYGHWVELNIKCHVGTIGAVFDFYAGTSQRAPEWWQRHSIEWLYRLIKEPKRMWRRYIIGNAEFLWYVFKEKTIC